MVFDSPPPAGLENAVVLIRNHPFVVGLSERVVGEAFKPQPNEKFARCGAAFTDVVKVRTVIALLRVRYRVTTRRHKIDQFAEEVVTSGFSRSDKGLDWLPTNDKETLALLETVAQKDRSHSRSASNRFLGHSRFLRAQNQTWSASLTTAPKKPKPPMPAFVS